MEPLVSKIAIIGLAGIGSQWLAWRFRLPAIVLLLLAGLIVGPATGWVVPERDLGTHLRPFVAVAVAIILFEGGLTLNFNEIRHTSTAVRRLVLIGAPLGWVLGALAARYVAGLSWQASAILGGILVVTGPTVIMPLLRQARLAARPASLLRWEAIVNDPVGALFAVLAFETMVVQQMGHSAEELLVRVSLALAVALIGGHLLGRAIVRIFNRGFVPEYLKAPVLLAAVLVAYAGSQNILEESGLLTVTVLGLTIGNARLASIEEIKRFKEIITVILVSGIFVLLTATLDRSTLEALDWRALAFVAAMLFVVRPLTTWIATIGSGLSWQERALIGWIAPRGIVAVAVTSFFASALTDISLSGGRKMVAIAFALVIATVVLHGFSIGPLARKLGLSSRARAGVLIVGGSNWSTALAAKLKELEVPVMIADSNWSHLSGPRAAGVPVFYGEILSEAAEHTVDMNPYSYLIAATDNDSYNALVCTNFAYEFGRNNVFQLAPLEKGQSGTHALSFTLGGNPILGPDMGYYRLIQRTAEGARFTASKISDKFTYADLVSSSEDKRTPLLVLKDDGRLLLATGDRPLSAASDDVVVSFG